MQSGEPARTVSVGAPVGSVPDRERFKDSTAVASHQAKQSKQNHAFLELSTETSGHRTSTSSTLITTLRWVSWVADAETLFAAF